MKNGKKSLNHSSSYLSTSSSNCPAPPQPQASSAPPRAFRAASSFPAYLEVPNAVVEAGGEDPVPPAAPRLGDDLDDLLQGAAHAVEHGVFVDPG